MDMEEQRYPSASAASPEIAAEVNRVRQRRSTLGSRRSCRSIGGRLSLAAPPHPGLQDQVLRVDEGQTWDIKLVQLLDIGLREAVRRLEARLPGDECAPELRAAVFTQAEALAVQLAEQVCGLTPAATAAAAAGNSSPAASASIEKYKEKTKELEEEYRKWKEMRRQREAECHAAEMEFQEAKTITTTMDESQEAHLSPAQHSLLESWPDCSCYVEEAQQAKDKCHLLLEEVTHTIAVVNGLLTASRFQAESSYTVLDNLSNARFKTQPMHVITKSIIQQHSTLQPGVEETQSQAFPGEQSFTCSIIS